MTWPRARRNGGTLVCTQPDGRSHGIFHRDGNTRWIGGHDGWIVDDYVIWWQE